MSLDLANSILSKGLTGFDPVADEATPTVGVTSGPQSTTNGIKVTESEFSRDDLTSPIPTSVLEENGVFTYTLPDGRQFKLDASGSPVISERGLSSAETQEIRGGTFQDTSKEVDHVVPISLGGTDDPGNLQVLQSKKTVSQSLFDFITGNERLPGSYKPENRQEGKMLVEWRANELYRAGDITLFEAMAAVQHYDNKDLVNDFLGEEFYDDPSASDMGGLEGGLFGAFMRTLDVGEAVSSAVTAGTSGAIGSVQEWLGSKLKESRRSGIINDLVAAIGGKRFIDPNDGSRMIFEVGAGLDADQAVTAAQTVRDATGVIESPFLALPASEQALTVGTVPIRWTAGSMARLLVNYGLEVSGSDATFTPETRLQEYLMGKEDFERLANADDIYGMAMRLVEEKLQAQGVAYDQAHQTAIGSALLLGAVIENPFFSFGKVPAREALERSLKETLEREVGYELSDAALREISQQADRILSVSAKDQRQVLMREFIDEFKARDVSEITTGRLALRPTDPIEPVSRLTNVVASDQKPRQSVIIEGDLQKPTLTAAEAEQYKQVINLDSSDDLIRLRRIIGDSETDEFLKTGLYRGRDQDYLEDLLKIKFVRGGEREILEFVPYDDASRVFYHGTSSENINLIRGTGFKKGADLPEGAFRSGGFDELQNSISFSANPKVASRFTGQASKGVVFEARIADDAFIVSAPEKFEDALDLEDSINQLLQNKVDAVWLGGGEEELVVLNPNVIEIGRAQEFKVIDGFKEFDSPSTFRDIAELADEPSLRNIEKTDDGTITYVGRDSDVPKVDPDRPKATIAEAESPRRPLTLDDYRNSVQTQAKQGFSMEPVKEFGQSVGEMVDKALAPISTRLANIDPVLKDTLRKHEFDLAQKIARDSEEIVPLMRSVQEMKPVDQGVFDIAAKNGDGEVIERLAKEYGFEDELAQTRTVFNRLYKEAEDVGYNFGYLDNYFPRVIKKPRALLRHIEKREGFGNIGRALAEKEAQLGRTLSLQEKADMVNTLIRGYRQGNISLSKTPSMQGRMIDYLDSDLNRYYHSTNHAMTAYINQVNQAISARKFFGKGDNMTDSIGAYTLDLVSQGKILPSQEVQLREMLQARFSPKAPGEVVNLYRNIEYITTMGSPSSAITQIGDLAWALYSGGPVKTLDAFKDAVLQRSKITVDDLGINQIAQEFMDQSRSAKAVENVFRLVGLDKMDRLGKETLVNSFLKRTMQQARTGKLSDDLLRKMNIMFGDDTAKVIVDLKNGQITEDVKLLTFNELLDFQPVAKSEMPEMYLRSGNGRIMYMLKTFTLKQFDVFRREAFQKIADPATRTEGVQNLVKLAFAFTLMGATADEIKAVLFNRPTSLDIEDGKVRANESVIWERLTDNIFRLMGVSKFAVWQARNEGIGSAIWKQFAPPFSVVDALGKDGRTVVTDPTASIEDLELPQRIPLAGKLYYWWLGRGAQKADDQRTDNLLENTSTRLFRLWEKDTDEAREQAAQDWDGFVEAYPELEGRLNSRLDDLMSGISTREKRIRNLGVSNGERAEAVYQQLEKLDTTEARADLWDDYVNKRIITDSVSDQLTDLLNANPLD